ncbi:MAG: BrnT family toxin [Eubacteriales bacterium]|nr:BrnT family toxin [Eubacteriales bacterium]
MAFEYDEEKNKINIKKHGIDFRSAARVFFDYDRIEIFDDSHSETEERYDTIGDTSIGNQSIDGTIIGTPFIGDDISDILFVVYTDRVKIEKDGQRIDVTRLISARLATEFERGVYYGKC